MKKYAIIIGHTKNKPGAASPYGIKPEFYFNTDVAEHLKDIADIYTYDTYRYGYSSMVKRLFDKINRYRHELTLELHYNAASPGAHGTEVLYYKDNRKGGMLASELSKLISNEFGTRNRGAQPKTKTDRGGYALYAGKPTALLLEPFFGSNMSDTAKFKGKEKEYADVIREFLKGL